MVIISCWQYNSAIYCNISRWCRTWTSSKWAAHWPGPILWMTVRSPSSTCPGGMGDLTSNNQPRTWELNWNKQQKWRNHAGYLSKWRNNGGYIEKQWITTIYYWISLRSFEINDGFLLGFGMGLSGDENRDLRYMV